MRKTSKQSYGGAYTPDGFPGRKAMSAKHMPRGTTHESTREGKYATGGKAFSPEAFPGYGCVSEKHGLTRNSSPTKGMINPEGRVGGNKKGFGSGNFKQGPCPIGSESKGSSHSYKPKKVY